MSPNAMSEVTDRLLERVDHVVYSTTDLEKSVAEIEKCL
jgi:hypothetical protein